MNTCKTFSTCVVPATISAMCQIVRCEGVVTITVVMQQQLVTAGIGQVMADLVNGIGLNNMQKREWLEALNNRL